MSTVHPSRRLITTARLQRDLAQRMAAGRATAVDATNVFPCRRVRRIAVAR